VSSTADEQPADESLGAGLDCPAITTLVAIFPWQSSQAEQGQRLWVVSSRKPADREIFQWKQLMQTEPDLSAADAAQTVQIL